MRRKVELLMRILVASLVVLFAGMASNDSFAQENCRNVGSLTRPAPHGPVLTIQAANGPFSFREGRIGQRCETTGDPNFIRPLQSSGGYKGLLDAAGRRTLVRAEYVLVTPINATHAIVQRDYSSAPMLYEFGRGEIGPSPHVGQVRLMGAVGVQNIPAIVTPVVIGPTTTIFLGGGRIETLSNVTDVMQFETFVLAHMNINGAEASQVFDAAMSEPRSPVVGRVEPWRIAPYGDRRFGTPLDSNQLEAYPQDLAARTITPNHPDLPDQLYLPLGQDGRPIPLPEGAIGVFPISYHNASYDIMVRRNVAHGWGIVFVTPRGFEITIGEGVAANVIAASANAYRWTGVRRYTRWAPGGEPRPGISPPTAINDWWLLRDASGRWRPASGTGLWANGPGAEDGFATREGAIAQAEVIWRANIERINLERAQAEAERQAQERRFAEEQWRQIQSGQRGLCDSGTFVGGLPNEGLERYMQQCRVSPEFVAQYRSRLSTSTFSAATERAREAEERYREEQAQLEYDRFFGGPVQPSDPWAAGLRAMQEAVDQQYDAVLAQQNRVYQQNLEAWNSGAQNWRYER